MQFRAARIAINVCLRNETVYVETVEGGSEADDAEQCAGREPPEAAGQ